ncbi:MAG: hypothetical protein KDK24_21030 [Pseudooceanicola sp.]|nr:hypothetical protein [Pseudooceanicola sp.]
MRVAVHTGAHFTDDERLMRCLLANKGDFSQAGIAVPGPGKYRTLLKETFAALDGAAPGHEAREVLVDAILDEESADAMILSNQHFFGSPRFAIAPEGFYPQAVQRMRQMIQLFHEDRVEMFLAICNPATFVPAVLAKASRQQQADLLQRVPPSTLRWSELLARLRAELPDLPITVWCNEDSPLLWPEIVRAVAGLKTGTKINGAFDLLRDIMSQEGMTRFRAYLAEHPDLSDSQKRRVMIAFLDKFAIEEALEEELDLPEWSEALVADLTRRYDDDLLRIGRIKGVRLLTL